MFRRIKSTLREPLEVSVIVESKDPSTFFFVFRRSFFLFFPAFFKVRGLHEKETETETMEISSLYGGKLLDTKPSSL